MEIQASANCETVEAGVIKVTVASDTAPDPGRLDECRKFVEATLGVPRVKVSVVSGTVEPNPESGATLPILIHQGSRDGTVDPILLKLARQDEDVYREARVAGFPSLSQVRSGLSVFLPVDGSGLNLRHILPLYDFAYFPVEAFHNRESTYGVRWQDVLLLTKTRRLVPVLTKRFGEYDQKRLRELFELGDVVSPRQLTVATAASLLDMNPLWRIAKEDQRLATTLLSDIRAGLTGANAPANITKFINEWIDFQTDGVTNFAAGALRQGGLLPLHFGPGALAAKLLRSLHGTKVPDLEATFTGMHVSHSMAMFAGCVPEAHARLYPLYELTTLMLGARYVERNDSPVKAIPFIADLDKLLESIELTIPDEMSVLDWIEKAGPAMGELRDALADLFSGSNSNIESVRNKTADVEWKIANLVENRETLKRSVDKFEIVGFAADAIAWLTDSGFPFAGTVICMIMKRTLPKLWHTLGESPRTRAARDILEGMGARISPNIVRLHRIVKKANVSVAE